MKRDAALLSNLAETFEHLDGLGVYSSDPAARALAVAGLDVVGFGTWRPVRMETDRSALDGLYARLPFRLPRLYEELILSYRWVEADLIGYRFLENPPGPDLSGLLSAILRDKHLFPTIFRHGYVQFAKGEGIDYDPVCFDSKRRRKGGDCPVVKLDHEEILCNERLVVVKELAPSFVKLVGQTIEAARQIRK